MILMLVQFQIIFLVLFNIYFMIINLIINFDNMYFLMIKFLIF